MTDEQPICGNCKHVRVKFNNPTHVCKLNCVGRLHNNGCMWDTKKYPSKFEPRDKVTCEWCTKTDLLVSKRHTFVRAYIFGKERTICRDCYDMLRVV
jgi:hypothetical protein